MEVPVPVSWLGRGGVQSEMWDGWMDGWRSLCSRHWIVFLQVLTGLGGGGSPASESLGEVTKMQIPSSMQIFCIRISTGGAQHMQF